MFRDRFWLSLALTIPVILCSHDLAIWLGYQAPMLPGSQWLPAILGRSSSSTAASSSCAGRAGELRDRQPGMMTLISLAIVVAFVTAGPARSASSRSRSGGSSPRSSRSCCSGTGWRCAPSPRPAAPSPRLPTLLPGHRRAGHATTATETVPLAALAVGDVVLVRPGCPGTRRRRRGRRARPTSTSR